jgi:hypothetical protein
MFVIFELNKKQDFLINKDSIILERDCFPIKVTLVNNKGEESERLIFIREKSGKTKMLIS